jgi:hypothetical protein
MPRKRPVCFPARNPAKQTPKSERCLGSNRILSGHSALRYEIEMSATPGLSRECRFGKNGKLFQPFVTMKLAGLSFALSI